MASVTPIPPMPAIRPALPPGQIEIMYTLLGDANLDGKVNGTDFNLMATNFNQAVTDGWDKGDFNYDGKVNGSDFVLLADNFNQFASQSAVSSGRPGRVGCLRRRERHQPVERARTRIDGSADPGRRRCTGSATAQGPSLNVADRNPRTPTPLAWAFFRTSLSSSGGNTADPSFRPAGRQAFGAIQSHIPDLIRLENVDWSPQFLRGARRKMRVLLS